MTAPAGAGAEPAVVLLDLDRPEDGHHPRYRAALGRLLGARRRGLGRESVCARGPVLIPSIEAGFALYVLICLVRALCGRRTVGLLFRPGPALSGRSVRLRAKRLALGLLRRLPRVRTLTILPFAVEPGFADIADGWIYDLQLWDLEPAERAAVRAVRGALAEDIRERAGGRTVCCAIGRQDKSKGFDRFVRLYGEDPDLRAAVLFAFGGKVEAEAKRHVLTFEQAGGFACDRPLSDAELLEFYAAADLVWCAYDPDYDQASGILGRAVQGGIPVVVRRGSLLHRLCVLENFPHIALDERAERWPDMCAHIPGRDSAEACRVRAHAMEAASLRRLREALGLAP